MLDAEALAGSIGRIYESLLGADSERIWLDEVRGIVGAEHACLHSVGEPPRWWSCSRFGAAERAIGDRFVRDPMYSETLAVLPVATPVRLSQFLPITVLRRSDMYQQMIRPLRGGIAAVYAWREGTALRAVAICRNAEGDRDYSDEELATLQPVVMHLRNAWELRMRLRTAEAMCVRAHAALDAMREGVVIVDARARLLYLNPAANALLCQADGIRLVQHTLRAMHAADDRRLHALVRTAAGVAWAGRRSGQPVPPCEPGPVALRRAPPRRPLLVSAMPACAARPLHDGTFDDAVMLVLRDPDCVIAPKVNVLAEAFRLTRREAELALALQAGRSMAESAAGLGISEGTARQYLKRVFAKTGVARQAELVGLLRSIA